MKFKKKVILWSALAGSCAILATGSFIGGHFATLHKTAINEAFGLDTYQTQGATGEHLYKSDYDYTRAGEVQDEHSLWNDCVDVANQVVEEGTVLLWNNGTLPLAPSSHVSLFSRSSVDPKYSGSGSGGAGTAHAVDLVSAMKNAGFSVNEALVNYYKGQPSRENQAPFARRESAWSGVSSQSFDGYGDCAFFMISTMGTEEGDLSMTNCDTTSGDTLDLTQEEKNAIEGLIALKGEGKFSKIVLLLNTCSTVNFRALQSYKSDIDACLWVGQPGGVGFTSTAEIIAGKRAPSGCLPDTFTFDSDSIPAVNCYGNKTFGDASGLNDNQSKYITYSEGIYVGYRYFETRYEDCVLGRGNATSTKGSTAGGAWSYAGEVAYPFGYNLSYTTFETSDYTVTEEEGKYTVSVKVTNTGSKPGKKAVQVYLQKPYTAYDALKGVEKASVELVGCAKTGELAAGASADITVNVDGRAFASFDADGEKTYILEEGDYYLAVGDNAHDALNNILAKKGKTTADGMDADGNSAFVEKITIGDDVLKKYAVSSTGADVVNRFDHADLYKAGYSSDKFKYLSRSDWGDTFPQLLSLTATAKYKTDVAFDKPIVEDENAKIPTYGAKNDLLLFQLTGEAYNSDKWDKYMDQITLKETSKLLASAYKNTAAISSMGKPGTKDTDGPLGEGSPWTVSKHASMSFPTAPMVGATFNDVLTRRVGVLKGENMLHAGYNGLYGTACGIHRIPYGGRAYEYYSEDSFLSGMCVTEETIGIQSKGGYVMIKHLALNDQEVNRKGIATFANEQTIREIYLEPFRMAVEIGKAKGLMSAFNRIGAIWCGADKQMLTNVLRGEWGFEGFVISDCPVLPYMSFIDGILAGNDIWLFGNPEDSFIPYSTSPTAAQAMRRAAKNVCYVVANSSAVNGMTSDTEIIEVVNWWQVLIVVIQVLFCAATATFAGLLTYTIIKEKKGKKRPEQTEKTE